MSTALDSAIEVCGGVTSLARLIEASPQSVTNWRARGVPAERCPLIERATAGRVRCEDLRPDVAWNVLREPSGSAIESARARALWDWDTDKERLK